MTEVTDKKKDSTLGYKILAVILAILLWIVVANISDYQTTKEIKGIPVTQINGDVLEGLDQIYDVVSGDTVDIIVKGRRSVVGNLTENDFFASADLSTMSITNSVQIEVNAKSESIRNSVSITCYDNTMKLNLEDKITKQFPIRVLTAGELKEGFAAGDTTVTPSIVTVEGPKSAVDRITDVVVSVDLLGRYDDFDAQGEVMLLDAYGEEIVNDKLVVDQGLASAHVSVYPTKTVDLIIDLKGTPEDNYSVESVVYQPEKVVIAGTSDIISKIDSIHVNNISINGMAEDYQTAIDLKDYMPEGVIVAQSNTEVMLTVKISETTEKVLKPSEKNITLEKQKDGCIYEVTVSEDFAVVFSGFEDEVNDLTLDDLSLTVDCSGFSVGNYHNVSVKLSEIEGIKGEVCGTVNIEVISK